MKFYILCLMMVLVQGMQSADLDIDLDTVGLDQGNWLLKRGWYEQSQDAYQQMQDWIGKILQARQSYVQSRQDIDAELDAHYAHTGFEQGQLAELIQALLEGNQSEQVERVNIELEQIKMDLESIQMLDESIDAAIKRVMEQIDQAGTYEKRAEQKLAEIGRILDDKRARELFYQVEGLMKDTQQLYLYVSRDLARFYEGLLEKIRGQLTQIDRALSDLKSKGLDLKVYAQKLEDDKAAQASKVPTQQASAQENTSSSSWFAAVIDWIVGILCRVWCWIAGLFEK